MAKKLKQANKRPLVRKDTKYSDIFNATVNTKPIFKIWRKKTQLPLKLKPQKSKKCVAFTGLFWKERFVLSSWLKSRGFQV